MKKLFTLVISLMLFSVALFSQIRPQPPVSVEMMFGDKKSAIMMGMNKQIIGPIRYNSITSASSYYSLDTGKPDLVMINTFLYQMHRNFGAGAGLQYHFLKGLVPSVSLNFGYSDSVWMVTVMPFINMRPETNSENVAIVEFKPQLTEKLKLYTHALALYNHNITLGEHDRSFYYFRLGLSMGQFTVGAAVNIDYYGPAKFNENNYGGFVKINI